MFRQLANTIAGGVATPASTETVLTSRPSELAEYLESCWLLRDQNLVQGLPAPAPWPAAQVPAQPNEDAIMRVSARPAQLDVPPGLPPAAGAVWPHLAYAFTLEQSRIIPVFRRLLELYVTGSIPLASWQSRNWIRAAEELFFASPRLPSVYSLESHIRPDGDARRRNAYYRLFGMDLSHGGEDGRPHGYVKSQLANREFVPVFETLLVEIWKAYSNRRNAIGPDTTDDNYIADLLRRLFDILAGQRLQGALAREEFEAVAMLSWFDLTLAFDTQVTRDLNAQASSPTERLFKIAQRAGVSVHVRTDSYFQMALPLSNILRGIESGALSGVPGAQALYLVAGPNQTDVLTLINHWSIATGRNLKDPTVRQPVGAALTTPSGAVGGNGGISRIAAVTR